MTTASLEALTPREREILVYIAKGDSLPEIAQKLHRSLKTIETHRLSIGRKLQASNRVELARIAIATGLVSALPENDEDVSAVTQAGKPLVHAEVELRWLEQINEAVYNATGPKYIRLLCDSMCDVLGMRICAICVSERGTDDAMRFTVALSEDGKTQDPIHYPLSDTPAELAVRDGVCNIPRDLAQACPNEQLLNEMGIQCYIAVRLDNERGEPIGVLAVADDKPAGQPEAVERILRFFAARTASELEQVNMADELSLLREQLERQVADRTAELQDMNARLDEIAGFYCGLASRMKDGLVILDRKWTITFANAAFAQMLGVARGDVVGRQADEWLTEESREVFRSMQPSREADQMQHYQVAFRKPDGSIKQVLVSPRAMMDEDGKLAGSFGIVTELSNLSRAVKPKTA